MTMVNGRYLSSYAAEVEALTSQHDRYDREDIEWLRDMAKARDDVCATYAIVVADDTPPIEAAAVLQSCFSLIVPAMRPLLRGLASYPFYLYTQFAKHFPDICRADLDRTVEKLLDCRSRYASRHCERSP